MKDTREEDKSKMKFETFYMKYTFKYTVRKEKDFRLLHATTCCDVTGGTGVNHGGFANLEYDVPKCPQGTDPSKCIHVEESVQYLDYQGYDGEDPDAMVDLVYAAGHLHKGGISIDLIDEASGKLLCRSEPRYGSSDQPGDENGYLVGVEPCVFPKGLRYKKSHLFRTIARYNNTEAYTGIMSLWLMSAADVQEKKKYSILSNENLGPEADF